MRVSFNDLEFFRPSLIRDTLPVHCDVSYLFARNQHDPTPGFLQRHLGINLSNSRAQIASAMEPESAKVFRRFMEREGWDKDAEMYFWDGRSLQAYLCVRRSPRQPDFSADELKFLQDLRTALGACVRRLRNQHREKLTTDCLQAVVEAMPLPILLLDWQIRPVCFNSEAQELCAEWIHGAQAARMFKVSDVAAIPAEVVAACLEWKKLLTAPDAILRRSFDRFAPSFETVHHSVRTDLLAQVELLEVKRDTIGMPHFLVRLQRTALNLTAGSSNQAPARATTLSALSCLSPREREIALRVQGGFTNEDIAAQLSKSVSTVKMQLQSIFRKLHVTNRTELAMRLNGASHF